MEKLYLCNMEDRKLLNIELGRISADEYRRRPESGIVVVLDNIRSAHNVGSAFRTSDAFGVDKIYLGGICPVPPSPELHKVALGAEEVVPFEHVADVVDLVHRLREEGYTVIAVEQTVNSVKLDEFRPEGGTDSAGHRPFSRPSDISRISQGNRHSSRSALSCCKGLHNQCEYTIQRISFVINRNFNYFVNFVTSVQKLWILLY